MRASTPFLALLFPFLVASLPRAKPKPKVFEFQLKEGGEVTGYVYMTNFLFRSVLPYADAISSSLRESTSNCTLQPASYGVGAIVCPPPRLARDKVQVICESQEKCDIQLKVPRFSKLVSKVVNAVT